VRLIPNLLVSATCCAFTPIAAAFQTALVSNDSAGVQGNSHSFSGPQVVSADGHFVAFGSLATNLVTGDTNSATDVFVRDVIAGTTERVSVATSGTQAHGDSYYPAISATGRFVAFESLATDLIPSDGGFCDIFVRDRVAGTTERVSVIGPGAGSGANGNSYAASISADGRYVAYHSDATNLVLGDTNGVRDVFVRDRTAGTTTRVSLGVGGVEGDASSESPAISGDGRYVAFMSLSTNFVPGDTNSAYDVFVRNRVTGTTERISLDSAGAQGNGYSGGPSISGDGRYIAFQSYASNLIPLDTNNWPDVFVRDRAAGTTVCLSLDGSGATANDMSESCSISADGRFVAFSSAATNLVGSDTNGYPDVFVHDRVTGTLQRESVTPGGLNSNQESAYPAISADNRYFVFQSRASNLVPVDNNGRGDVFIRDRGPQEPILYCSSGTTSNGCIATIGANLNPSLTLANTCTITVTNVEGQKSGILFYGIDNTAFVASPWAPGSASVLCVKHPTQRTPLQNSAGTISYCNGSYSLNWNAYQTANPLSLGNPWSVGAKVYVQAWFRDPPAVKATNLSDALQMTYQP
jgi:Tol biopolymer transport system component